MSIPDHAHYVPPGDVDITWQATAIWLRKVLATAYGREQDNPCLPGEPGWCGHGFAQHAAASIGALWAVAQDLYEHLPTELTHIADGIHENKLAELRAKADHTHDREASNG